MLRVEHFVCFGLLLAGMPAVAEENPKPKEFDETEAGTREPEPDFAKLETLAGEAYLDCHLVRSDAEGLLIRHRGGMARISFFDLPAEIRDRFEFDPVTALRLYRERQAEERSARKERLIAAERYRAGIAEKKALEDRRDRARSEWIPVEASILRLVEDGLLLRADRIVFEPTTETSTLGFERPGPPRKVLRAFAPEIILIDLSPFPQPDPSEASWKGYVEPQSRDSVSVAGRSEPVPRHRATPP